MMHCTQDEVAAWFGVTQKTISIKLGQARYKRVWETGWGKGKISLRRMQKQRADAGDKTMLIWLGKQWLGQADKSEVRTSTLDSIEAELDAIERKRHGK